MSGTGRHSGAIAATLAILLFASAQGHAQDRAAEHPRLMRFLSTLPEHEGRTCFGHVVEDRDGIPATILNLGTIDERLCSDDQPADSEPSDIVRAFAIARRAIGTPIPAQGLERLPESELALRVLPPVAISRQALEAGRRLVIGAGLNFSEHRLEVGESSDAESADLVLFPKPVVPTGAYSPMPTGIEIGSSPPTPVRLLDYELEIGVVFLEAIDLNAALPSRDTLFESIAFFAANDVSARAAIIRDDKFGYTQGKARPGHLPIGPWLVHGGDLDLAAGGFGSQALAMTLSVRDDGVTQLRQSDSSASMLHGVSDILAEIGRRYRNREPLCMRDMYGRPYLLHDGRGAIPAGSLLLTGTPGGTALQSPGVLDSAWLFLRGGLSIGGARRTFIEDSIEDDNSRYLRPGAAVTMNVELLGTQRWTVVRSDSSEESAEPVPGECED